MAKGRVIKLTAGRKTFEAYLALPSKGKGSRVLVLHAWWGLTDFFKGFCQKLANEGFVALAPDLYDGITATTIDQAKKARSKMGRKETKGKIDAALDHLLAIGIPEKSAAVVGFSLGGYFALGLSSTRPEVKAVVLFYGVAKDDQTGSQAAFLGHFAERDKYVSARSVHSLETVLRSAGRDFEFHIYPKTGHWFLERDRRDAYDATSAALAWKRTVEFLKVQR